MPLPVRGFLVTLDVMNTKADGWPLLLLGCVALVAACNALVAPWWFGFLLGAAWGIFCVVFSRVD